MFVQVIKFENTNEKTVLFTFVESNFENNGWFCRVSSSWGSEEAIGTPKQLIFGILCGAVLPILSALFVCCFRTKVRLIHCLITNFRDLIGLVSYSEIAYSSYCWQLGLLLLQITKIEWKTGLEDRPSIHYQLHLPLLY